MISYKNKTVQMSVSKIYGKKRILPITYCNIRTLSIVAYFYHYASNCEKLQFTKYFFSKCT